MNDNQRDRGPYFFGYFNYNGLIMAKIYGDTAKNGELRTHAPVQEHQINEKEADFSISELKEMFPYVEKETS